MKLLKNELWDGVISEGHDRVCEIDARIFRRVTDPISVQVRIHVYWQVDWPVNRHVNWQVRRQIEGEME